MGEYVVGRCTPLQTSAVEVGRTTFQSAKQADPVPGTVFMTTSGEADFLNDEGRRWFPIDPRVDLIRQSEVSRFRYSIVGFTLGIVAGIVIMVIS